MDTGWGVTTSSIMGSSTVFVLSLARWYCQVNVVPCQASVDARGRRQHGMQDSACPPSKACARRSSFMAQDRTSCSGSMMCGSAEDGFCAARQVAEPAGAAAGVAYVMSIVLSSPSVDPSTLAPQVHATHDRGVAASLLGGVSSAWPCPAPYHRPYSSQTWDPNQFTKLYSSRCIGAPGRWLMKICLCSINDASVCGGRAPC